MYDTCSAHVSFLSSRCRRTCTVPSFTTVLSTCIEFMWNIKLKATTATTSCTNRHTHTGRLTPHLSFTQKRTLEIEHPLSIGESHARIDGLDLWTRCTIAHAPRTLNCSNDSITRADTCMAAVLYHTRFLPVQMLIFIIDALCRLTKECELRIQQVQDVPRPSRI